MYRLVTPGVVAFGALTVAALLGAGTAAADDYAGQTYSDASQAASKAKQTVVVAARNGDSVSQDSCIVSRSQPAPFANPSGVAVSGTVLFYLDCNAPYATAGKPGPSIASPEGRAAKAKADAAAAEEQQKEEAAAAAG